MNITKEAQDFLESLLFSYGDQSVSEDKEIQESAIWEFSEPFIRAVESFIEGFENFLESKGFEMERLENLTRSFGGNCYFSLSGHGVGFWDERDEAGEEVNNLLKEYSGDPYRFEQICLDKEDDVIDLSILPEFIKTEREKLFNVKNK